MRTVVAPAVTSNNLKDSRFRLAFLELSEMVRWYRRHQRRRPWPACDVSTTSTSSTSGRWSAPAASRVPARSWRLSAATVSAQLRTLEERLGEKLLVKSGRKLVPTEVGRLVYSYAQEIFGLGRELTEALEASPLAASAAARRRASTTCCRRRSRSDCSNPPCAWRSPCASPAARARSNAWWRISPCTNSTWCFRTRRVTPTLNVRAYSHVLGSCAVCWMATPAIAASPASRISAVARWRAHAAAHRRHRDPARARSMAGAAGCTSTAGGRIRGLRAAARIRARRPRLRTRARGAGEAVPQVSSASCASAWCEKCAPNSSPSPWNAASSIRRSPRSSTARGRSSRRSSRRRHHAPRVNRARHPDAGLP